MLVVSKFLAARPKTKTPAPSARAFCFCDRVIDVDGETDACSQMKDARDWRGHLSSSAVTLTSCCPSSPLWASLLSACPWQPCRPSACRLSACLWLPPCRPSSCPCLRQQAEAVEQDLRGRR